MNSNSQGKHRTYLYVLVQCLLCLGLLFLAYTLLFKNTRALSLQEASATKTAVAGTVQALMGPFPTATIPTKTPTPTGTVTPLVSATPTITPTATRAPTKTPTRFASKTPVHRNDQPGSSVIVATSRVGTPIPVLPTDSPATEPPTDSPVATEPPATGSDPTQPPVSSEPVQALITQIQSFEDGIK